MTGLKKYLYNKLNNYMLFQQWNGMKNQTKLFDTFQFNWTSRGKQAEINLKVVGIQSMVLFGFCMNSKLGVYHKI